MAKVKRTITSIGGDRKINLKIEDTADDTITVTAFDGPVHIKELFPLLVNLGGSFSGLTSSWSVQEPESQMDKVNKSHSLTYSFVLDINFALFRKFSAFSQSYYVPGKHGDELKTKIEECWGDFIKQKNTKHGYMLEPLANAVLAGDVTMKKACEYISADKDNKINLLFKLFMLLKLDRSYTSDMYHAWMEYIKENISEEAHTHMERIVELDNELSDVNPGIRTSSSDNVNKLSDIHEAMQALEIDPAGYAYFHPDYIRLIARDLTEPVLPLSGYRANEEAIFEGVDSVEKLASYAKGQLSIPRPDQDKGTQTELGQNKDTQTQIEPVQDKSTQTDAAKDSNTLTQLCLEISSKVTRCLPFFNPASRGSNYQRCPTTDAALEGAAENRP